MNELSYSYVNKIDVLVIGAGPIGLATTIWFAKRNYNVMLIEQYAEIKNPVKRAFNERHQQIGLDPNSLNFIKDLDVVIWGEIKRKGCMDGDWINIPIYIIQNILLKEIRNHKNATILFSTTIDSVNCPSPKENCRVILIKTTNSDVSVYGIAPKIIIIADGRHDDKGTAKQFFNFSSASKVNLSTYGIVGMIERNINDDHGSICLKNHSSDFYLSESNSQLGQMYIRLLGNMKERYVALGLANNQNVDKFKNLNTNQIKSLLIEAYNLMRDKTMGEPEIDDTILTDFSKTPIPIVLDYRKETIKLLEGSSTIVSIEGDAARKTTFFSGSGLNSGYRALTELFTFCRSNESFIFNNSNDPNYLLTIDQKLLEKDQDCMKISLELLIKGINYIVPKSPSRAIVPPLLHSSSYSVLTSSFSSLSTSTSPTSSYSSPSHSPKIDDNPIIHFISPNKGEVPWFIHIIGNNLIGTGGKPPTCIFEWKNGSFTTDDVIVYDNTTIGVKIPKNAKHKVSIRLKRFDEKIVDSPISFHVVKINKRPEITNIHKEDSWLYVEGKHFKAPSYVIIGEEKIKAYCNSVHSLVFSPTSELSGEIKFRVQTDNGVSDEYIKDVDTILKIST